MNRNYKFMIKFPEQSRGKVKTILTEVFVGNRLSRKTMEICTYEVKSRQAAPPAVAVKPNTGAADPLAFCAGKVICRVW